MSSSLFNSLKQRYLALQLERSREELKRAIKRVNKLRTLTQLIINNPKVHVLNYPYYRIKWELEGKV